MKMKTFEAESMVEVLSKVKQELGPDAVILKNRQVSRRSGGRIVSMFEVTAATEDSPAIKSVPVSPPAINRNTTTANRPMPTGGYDWSGKLPRVTEEGRSIEVTPNKAKAPPLLATAARKPFETINDVPALAKTDGQQASNKFMELLRTEFREVKESVEMPTRELRVLKEEIRGMIETASLRAPLSRTGAPIPRDIALLRDHLEDCGFMPAEAEALAGEAFARSIPQGADPYVAVCATVRKRLLESIRVTGGVRFAKGRSTKVALVGPAGAGKTTTLLKLAGTAALRGGRRVGILAGDAARMGALAQLEAFGRRAGIPVLPVFEPQEVEAALTRMQECDLILMDTTGRAPIPNDAMSDRQTVLLNSFAADETLLTLSAVTRTRELENQCRGFQPYRPASLVFTRLDECLSLGGIWSLAQRTGLPLGYLCDGTSVPEHIQTARPHVLGQLLVPNFAPEGNFPKLAARA